jgi:growth factor receptor bound protein 2-associated protein 2
VQKLSHGLSHCLNGTGAHLQGFYSLPKPGKPHLAAHHHHHDPAGEEACYVLPRSYGSDATALDLERDEDEDEEEVYTFKTPCNALAAAGPSAHGERPSDNYDLPTTPGSFYQIPRAFDKNHNSLTPSSSESSSCVAAPPPPRPPKPSQGSDSQWGSPKSAGSQNGEAPANGVSVIPRRNTLPAVENVRLHRGNAEMRMIPGIVVYIQGIMVCIPWIMGYIPLYIWYNNGVSSMVYIRWIIVPNPLHGNTIQE